MDPATVQALRDIKALLDENILDASEFAAKKAELLAAASAKTSAASAKTDAPSTERKKSFAALSVIVKDCGDDGVLVTGDGTFKARSVLSQLGGSWSKSLKAWVFATGRLEEIKAGLEASTAPKLQVQVEVSESLANIKSQLVDAKQEALNVKVDAAVALSMEPHKRAVVVKGSAKPLVAKLKALGGSWNRTLGGWCFPKKSYKDVLASLRLDPKVSVTVDEALEDDDEEEEAGGEDAPPVAEPKVKAEEESAKTELKSKATKSRSVSSRKTPTSSSSSKLDHDDDDDDDDEPPAKKRKQKLSLWSLSASQTESEEPSSQT